MTQNTNEPLHIVGTDLLDYSFKVEKAVKEGWTFSDKNEYAPRTWPHMFEAWMLLSPKDEEGNLKEDALEPSQSLAVESKDTSKGVDSLEDNKAAIGASKPVAKRGRK